MDYRIDFRYATAETALHQSSVPVTITTGHIHQERPSLWTVIPGKMMTCRHVYEGKCLHCVSLAGFVFCSVCENRKWKCTAKVCDGVCHTVGEGHYITFDGLKYSFPGLCQYVLVQVRDKDMWKQCGALSLFKQNI